jgi:hypothetical protein
MRPVEPSVTKKMARPRVGGSSQLRVVFYIWLLLLGGVAGASRGSLSARPERASGLEPTCSLDSPEFCEHLDAGAPEDTPTLLLEAIKASEWRIVSAVISLLDEQAAIPLLVDVLQVTDDQVGSGTRLAGRRRGWRRSGGAPVTCVRARSASLRLRRELSHAAGVLTALPSLRCAPRARDQCAPPQRARHTQRAAPSSSDLMRAADCTAGVRGGKSCPGTQKDSPCTPFTTPSLPAPQGFTAVNLLACAGKGQLLADLLNIAARLSGPNAHAIRT